MWSALRWLFACYTDTVMCLTKFQELHFLYENVNNAFQDGFKTLMCCVMYSKIVGSTICRKWMKFKRVLKVYSIEFGLNQRKKSFVAPVMLYDSLFNYFILWTKKEMSLYNNNNKIITSDILMSIRKPR